MTRHTRPAATILAGGLVSLVLSFAAAGAEEAAGRYTMTPTDGGFIRLDTQTGAMSLCTNKDGSWACRAMPDDQKALQDHVARLEAEVKSLKDENKRLEDVLGLNPDKPKDGPGLAAPQDGTTPAPPPQSFKLPSEKDVDKAFDYFEGLLKKFKDRLKKLEEQEKSGGTVPL